jgi:hypothetical protein
MDKVRVRYYYDKATRQIIAIRVGIITIEIEMYEIPAKTPFFSLFQ